MDVDDFDRHVLERCQRIWPRHPSTTFTPRQIVLEESGYAASRRRTKPIIMIIFPRGKDYKKAPGPSFTSRPVGIPVGAEACRKDILDPATSRDGPYHRPSQVRRICGVCEPPSSATRAVRRHEAFACHHR